MKIYCKNKEKAEQVELELRQLGEPAEIINNDDQWQVETTEYAFRRWRM